jgi:hypothetical protein
MLSFRRVCRRHSPLRSSASCPGCSPRSRRSIRPAGEVRKDQGEKARREARVAARVIVKLKSPATLATGPGRVSVLNAEGSGELEDLLQRAACARRDASSVRGAWPCDGSPTSLGEA